MTSFADINHPLGLRHLPLSYGGFTKLAYERFADSKTLIFLDTNILGLPFRFHSEARKGFFSLLQVAIEQKRLFVPAWASNEFFHNAFKLSANAHGFAGNVKFMNLLPEKEKILGVLGKAASVTDLSKLATDLSVASSGVLAKIAQIAGDWNGAISKIGADLDPETIHAELNAHLSDCFLSLNFNEHCTAVHMHADRRRANRIPPGLTDGGKSDSDKRGRDTGNVDGDLALWLEILDNAERIKSSAPASAFDCVIVLTEERKRDFLYAPVKREADLPSKKPIVGNATPPVLLIDPRLVSEFESRMQHRNIAFINVETLAHGWQAVNGGLPGGDNIRAFARALMQQIDTDPEQGGELPVEAEVETGAATTIPADPAAPLPAAPAVNAGPGPTGGLDIPKSAANDEKAFIDTLAALPGIDIVRALNTHNWYVQNPAVQALMREGVPVDQGVAFLVGRALYQAAEGNAWRADTYIKKFDDWATERSDAEQALLAGTAYEALFDGTGHRRDDPKTRNLHHVLEMLCKPHWLKAREWFVRQMNNSQTVFYWMPGQSYPRITASVEGANNGPYFEMRQTILRSPGFSEVALFKPLQTGDFAIGSFSVDELLEWIADHTLVPPQHIDLSFTPPTDKQKINVPAALTINPQAICRLSRKP